MTKPPRPVIFTRMNHSIAKAVLICFAAGALLLPACVQGQEKKAKTEASTAAADSKAEWKNLFDGKSLKGWKQTDFGGGGPVHVEAAFKNLTNVLVIDMGESLSGMTWTNEVFKTNYEIELDAMRIDGNDFFVGLTVPVAESHCTWVLGGWGGAVVGISNIDGSDASENETTKFMAFEKNKWFNIRLRVTPKRIEGWINGEKLVDQDITDRKISMRLGEIESSIPLGIATYQSTTAIKSIKMRKL